MHTDKKEWVSFYNSDSGKILGRISIEGLFHGEIQSVRELYAYEEGLNVDKIEVKFE